MVNDLGREQRRFVRQRRCVYSTVLQTDREIVKKKHGHQQHGKCDFRPFLVPLLTGCGEGVRILVVFILPCSVLHVAIAAVSCCYDHQLKTADDRIAELTRTFKTVMNFLFF